MAEPDILSAKYMEDPRRIADLLNVTTLRGKRILHPNHIRISGSRNYLPNHHRKKKTIIIDRDIVCDADVQMKATIIALENQSDIHYVMPVRVMSGDSANYHNQWNAIKKQHGELNDLNGPEFISGFSKEDLKLVFGFLQRDSDGDMLQSYVKEYAEEFADISEDTYSLIGAYSKSKNLLEKKDEFRTETGGVNMCKALEQIEERGMELGMEWGKELGIQNIIKACKNLDVSIEKAKNQIQMLYSLAGDQVDAYIQKYWR